MSRRLYASGRMPNTPLRFLFAALRANVLVIVVIFVLGPRSAMADAPLDRAKALAAQAEVEYKLAHFQEALDKYSAAYATYASAGLLFNIGQCHKMLKHHERAIFFFQGYLRDKPSATNRATVLELIAESRRELERERAERSSRSAVPPPPAASTPTPSAPYPIYVSVPMALPRTPDDIRAEKRRAEVLLVAGAVTASVGAVLVGTGVYFGLRSQSAARELEELASTRGAWSADAQSTYDAGKSSATAATILYVAGGVALAGGATLAFLGWRRKSPDGTGVSVMPTLQGVSLAAACRF